jgi:acyl-CoA thioesterase
MDIQQFLNANDHFAAGAGCRIIEITEGRAVATMTVTKGHLNAGGVCQGGALFTLADLALAAVMNSRGQLTFGIQNNIMYLSSAREGDLLTAEAIEVFNHHKIPAVEVRITNQQGKLLCHVTGMAYRKPEPLK